MNYLLIGKPNVGKSSIFNILTSLNLNIIHSESGTTRDWHKEIIKGTNSYVFDTPGILMSNLFRQCYGKMTKEIKGLIERELNLWRSNTTPLSLSNVITDNNILILEFNNRGVLIKKEFLDLTNMNKLKFAEKQTESNYRTNTFMYDFLSSMRQKINDPLGKRKKN